MERDRNYRVQYTKCCENCDHHDWLGVALTCMLDCCITDSLGICDGYKNERRERDG
jgi:hypothetical protein